MRKTNTPRPWASRCLACILLLLLAAGPANATPDLSQFASSSFADIAQAVDALASSGDPRAGDILAALQAGRLVVGTDRQVYIRTGNGAVNAATGEPASAPARQAPARCG